jgi:DNA-binding beta-propeller fold protein YncE
LKRAGWLTVAGVCWLSWAGLTAGALPATAAEAAVGVPKLGFLFMAPKDSVPDALLNPTGLACDAARDRVYVADSSHSRVVVFNNLGSRLFTFQHWVRSANGQRMLGAPMCLLPWDGGTLVVTDALSPRLDIVDIYGAVVNSIDFAPLMHQPEPVNPGATGEDQAGNLYVVERSSQRVVVLNHGGTRVLRVFGGKGEDQGTFQGAEGLAVAPDGTTYVLDSMRGPIIQVFDPQGKFVTGFGQEGDRAEDFHHPTSVALDGDGRLWIVDTISQDVKCFTTSGRFLASFGGLGTGPGQFYFPIAVAVGGDILYVLEKAGARVQAFRIIP